MRIPRKIVDTVLRVASIGARRRVYRLEVAAVDRELLTVKDFIHRICTAGNCAPRETANIKLAVDEACTNVIRHAYGGDPNQQIELEASLGPYDITVRIRDKGKPFDFKNVRDPDLNHYVEIGRKGGLGIWLIKKVMSRVEYTSRKGVNELVLVRYFDLAQKVGAQPKPKLRAVPISVKFTVGSVALAVAIIVSGYVVVSRRQKTLLENQQREKVVAILNTVALEAGEAVARKKDLELNDLVHKIASNDRDRVLSYAFIMGQDGKFLAHTNYDLLFQNWQPPMGLKPLTDDGVRFQRIGSITHYGARIPFQGHTVGEVRAGVDEISLSALLARSEGNLRAVALWALVLSVVLIWMLSLIVTRPIQRIFEGVQALHGGDLSAKIKLDTQDEFGQLASIFNDMTAKIQESQMGMMEHERLQKEMQVAQEIQHTLLPAQFPTIDGYEIGGLYRAAKEVGGDYYDFFWVDPTTMGIVVADVSGKGVPGSLVMTMIRTAMRLEARGNKSASEVLSRVNQHVTADMKKGMFVTMFYVILDSRRRVISFSSAGHNPMILYRGRTQQVYFLKPKGFPLGIALPDDDLFNRSLAIQKTSLEKGDMLVIYTDGITEAMNTRNEQFGEERLIAAIRENAQMTPDEFVNELNRRIAEFTEGAEQHDDITVVAIKEKLKAETVLFKANRKLFDLVEKKGLSVAEACRQMNVSSSRFYRLKRMVAASGKEALRESLHRGHSPSLAELSNDQKKAVLQVVKDHPEFGASRIAEYLRSKAGGSMRIDERLVYQYLKRKGMNTEEKRRNVNAGAIDSL